MSIITDIKKNKKGQESTTRTGVIETIGSIKEIIIKTENISKLTEEIENKITRGNNIKQDTNKEKDHIITTGMVGTITKKKAGRKTGDSTEVKRNLDVRYVGI